MTDRHDSVPFYRRILVGSAYKRLADAALQKYKQRFTSSPRVYFLPKLSVFTRYTYHNTLITYTNQTPRRMHFTRPSVLSCVLLGIVHLGKWTRFVLVTNLTGSFASQSCHHQRPLMWVFRPSLYPKMPLIKLPWMRLVSFLPYWYIKSHIFISTRAIQRNRQVQSQRHCQRRRQAPWEANQWSIYGQ